MSPTNAASPSSSSRPYRIGMWIFLAFAFPLLGLALAGARKLVPPAVGILAMAGFFCCLAFAVMLGYRSRRVAMEERQQGSATSMLVMMASILNQEDDATLRKIAGKGGPAGEAAAMLLERRHETVPGRPAGS